MDGATRWGEDSVFPVSVAREVDDEDRVRAIEIIKRQEVTLARIRSGWWTLRSLLLLSRSGDAEQPHKRSESLVPDVCDVERARIGGIDRGPCEIVRQVALCAECIFTQAPLC